MKTLIRKILREAVGVPADIEKSAENLYNDLIDKIKSLGSVDLEDTDGTDIEFKFDNRDKKYSFADFNPKRIFIELNIRFYNSTEHTEPMIYGMGHIGRASLSDKLTFVSEPTNNINLQISYAQPEDDTEVTTDKIINTLEKNKKESVSSLSHELKHAYDSSKNPIDTLKSRTQYSVFSNVRLNIPPLNEFIFNLYFIHNIENLVRPVEVYTDMVQSGVKTKQEFLDFFKNQKVLKTLKRISTYTFDELIDDISKYETEIDDFLNNKLNLSIDNLDLEQKVFMTLEYFYKIIQNNIKSRYDMAVVKSMAQNMNGMDRFMAMIFGNVSISEKNRKLMTKLKNEVTKFDNNPLDFYDYEMKKSKMIAEKMIKKLSKLFSLVEEPKTIKTEIFDPMNFEMDQLRQRIKPRKSSK
jgi:hypothetical protein